MRHTGENQSNGDTMSSTQINVGISPITAVNEALKFLIRLAEQIKSLSKNVETDMSLTDALVSSRDGGDL
jgi:hypothetical protein